MLTREQYIQMSLEFNLFWVRIMKEHAFFIESSVTPPIKHLGVQAGRFRKQYEGFLADTIRLANASVSRGALQSGQFFTKYTEEAERLAQQYTGLNPNINLTRMEYSIEPYDSNMSMSAQKEEEVSVLNRNILNTTSAFAQFKSELLNRQSSCLIFTFLYTADIDHILREAKKYIDVLTRLNNREDHFAQDYRKFWTQNMSDHSKSMRGLFDPTEAAYFSEADRFANIFDSLLQSGAYVNDANTEPDTKALSVFKADTAEGQIECKVKALMLALYTDHLLREANHFLYLLNY